MKFIILALFTLMAVRGQILNPIQLQYPQYYQKFLSLGPYYHNGYPWHYFPTFYPYPVNYFQAALEFPQSQELPIVEDSETTLEVPKMDEGDGKSSLKNLSLRRDGRECKWNILDDFSNIY